MVIAANAAATQAAGATHSRPTICRHCHQTVTGRRFKNRYRRRTKSYGDGYSSSPRSWPTRSSTGRDSAGHQRPNTTEQRRRIFPFTSACASPGRRAVAAAGGLPPQARSHRALPALSCRVGTIPAGTGARHQLSDDFALSRAPAHNDLLAAAHAKPNLIGAGVQRERPRGQGRAGRKQGKLLAVAFHRGYASSSSERRSRRQRSASAQL
jgi:hypothetical protein